MAAPADAEAAAGTIAARRRRGTFLAVALALGLAAALYAAVLFFTARGLHPTKLFGRLSIGLAIAGALLVPLALAESRGDRRFARLEAALRERLPAATVSAYEGAEGRGTAFDTPDGRRVLLVRRGARFEAPHLVEVGGRARVVRSPDDLPPLLPQGAATAADPQADARPEA